MASKHEFLMHLFGCNKSCLLSGFFILLLLQGHGQDTIRIMPIGNSITQAENQGPDQYNSWRRQLYLDLIQVVGEPHHIDFIGSHAVAHPGVPFPDNDFDQDHEGHWGWRIDEIRANLGGWIQLPHVGVPDIALVHLGSNDCFQGQSIPSSVVELEDVIDTLRNYNSDILIFLAQIIPSSLDSLCIEELNDSIIDIVARKSLPSSPIVLVDQNSGFSSVTDTYDAIHPNLNGEMKMADRWFEALLPHITMLTATDIQLQTNDLEFYPNPTNGIFEIRGQLSQYELDILDVNGNVYESLSNTESSILYDLSTLPAGLYFIRIRHQILQALWIQQIIKM